MGGDAMGYTINYGRNRVMKRKSGKGRGMLGSLLIIGALLIRLFYPDFVQWIRTVMLKEEAVAAFAQDFSAAGLMNGDFCEADYVVSAADWHWTMFDALGGRYIPSDMMKYRNIADSDVYYSYCILFLGVKDGLKQHPHFLRFYTDPYSLPDGTQFDKMEVHIYNYDETLAGDDKCTIAVYFQTQNGGYWIDKRANDRSGYEAEKKQFTALAIDKLVEHFGENFRDKIEVSDLTTPATYHRYKSQLKILCRYL